MSAPSDPSGGGSAPQGLEPNMPSGLGISGEAGLAAGRDFADGISGSGPATPSSRNSTDCMLPPSDVDDSSKHLSPFSFPGLHPNIDPDQPSTSSKTTDPLKLRHALQNAIIVGKVQQLEEKSQGPNPIVAARPVDVDTDSPGAGAGAGSGPVSVSGVDSEDSAPPTPRLLKPVFKRESSYNNLQDIEAADHAQQHASQRHIRAMAKAQGRAGRLAVRLQVPEATRSAPASRRGSLEREPVGDSYFPPVGYTSVSRGRDGGPAVNDNASNRLDDNNTHNNDDGNTHKNDDDDDDDNSSDDLPELRASRRSLRHRPPYAREASQEDLHHHQDHDERGHQQRRPPPPRYQQHPDEDVYQNGRRTLMDPFGRDLPTSHYYEDADDMLSQTPTLLDVDGPDYVARPTKFRRGILGSLMGWRSSERRDDADSHYSRSGFSTPMTCPSPPASRASSPLRAGRPTHRLRNLGGLSKSSSTATLAELIKNSSSKTAQRSGEISDQLIGKLKKKVSRSKTRRKNQSIKIHIADILSRHRYLIKLCRALMMYGAPTHRLEEYMTMSSRILEIEAQFLYMPGCMFISFDDHDTHTTELKFVRVPHGVDLGRMREVHEVYKLVVHDRLSVIDATDRLQIIMDSKPRYHRWVRVLMYGVASACVAPFAFQGRFVDLPVAFFLGCIVGALQLFCAPRNDIYAHVFEVTAALITSFAARGFGSMHEGKVFCFSALAQSSIALILPGYMVLCASLELQSNNMVPGGVRMVHALIYTLFLGYGITIGASLYGMLDHNAVSATTCSRPLDSNWNLIFVPAFTLCLCVINQAKWTQMPVMLVISLFGFITNSYTSRYFVDSPQISNMLGAMAVGILANLYSRLGGYPEFYWYKLRSWWAASQMRHRLAHSRVTRRLFASRAAAAAASSSSAPCGSALPQPSSSVNQQPVSVSSPPASELDIDLESNVSAEDEKRRREQEQQNPSPPDSDSSQASSDPHEIRSGPNGPSRLSDLKKTGYNLAAAAMLPAIFVQVPSGLAAGGSLMAGVNSANQINSNHTASHLGSTTAHILDGSPFSVLFSVIQVAISLSVGLFLSHLLVYPLGKRRSGLFSF